MVRGVSLRVVCLEGKSRANVLAVCHGKLNCSCQTLHVALALVQPLTGKRMDRVGGVTDESDAFANVRVGMAQLEGEGRNSALLDANHRLWYAARVDLGVLHAPSKLFFLAL